MLSHPDAVTSLASGLGIGGGLALGLQFMKWLLTFAAGRQDKQQEHIDEGVRELIAGLRQEVNTLKADRLADKAEIETFRKELRDCERKHAESEAKVSRLEALLQGYGDARQHAALIVAAEKAKEA